MYNIVIFINNYPHICPTKIILVIDVPLLIVLILDAESLVLTDPQASLSFRVMCKVPLSCLMSFLQI